MTEAFLQYVWQHQLMCLDKLCTTDNEPISVISIGTFNTNAGPDFLNAKIKIGNTIWAGDVEVHIKSSDWNNHQHQFQKTYNSVILHAVSVFEGDVFRENGQKIPTIVLPILTHIEHNYMSLKDLKSGIRCKSQIKDVDSIRISMFLERLVAERFEQKSSAILELFSKTNNNWEETLYQLLARSFGFKTNSDAFEAMAKSLPYSVIAKHHDNLFQIESLLFGQANIWSDAPDDYEQSLQKEAKFLQKKYKLTPISSTWWKFARMRPYNFPTIRIAQFAKLLFQTEHLVSHLIECRTIEEITHCFACKASEYWDTHFSLSKISPKHNTKLGQQGIQSIVINTVIPFLFTYGKERQLEAICERSYHFLISLTAEKNTIISQWNNANIKTVNAFETQGLIQLYNAYCSLGRCTRCAIGHIILNRRK